MALPAVSIQIKLLRWEVVSIQVYSFEMQIVPRTWRKERRCSTKVFFLLTRKLSLKKNKIFVQYFTAWLFVSKRLCIKRPGFRCSHSGHRDTDHESSGRLQLKQWKKWSRSFTRGSTVFPFNTFRVSTDLLLFPLPLREKKRHCSLDDVFQRF